jgi:hydroxymethylglutaryl-CoA reductase (NADPH)
LPSIVVGTVGGGTALPSQRACLEILGLAGPGNAQALAEVCAALALAGELSITAALCSGDFTHAHQKLARGNVAAGSDNRR